MGILDKLKNVLFEEEYVEVEEKPKKKPVPKKTGNKSKGSVKSAIKEKLKVENVDYEDEVENKPIAKKVVLPDRKEEKNDSLKFETEEFEPVIPANLSEKHNDFMILDDDDFKVEEEPDYPEIEPQIVKVIEKETYSNNRPEKPLYPSKPEKKHLPYGEDESPRNSVSEYNAYDRKEERNYFRPSPIISPIYGILDKNYKKEDVVQKREIRPSSSFSKDKLSVDEVRMKAYGEDNETAKRFEEKLESPTFEVEEESNLFVDLNEEATPEVKEVTMGDAIEYYQDLGLEYNVDYVDAGKKSTTPRREKEVYATDLIPDRLPIVEPDDSENKKNDKNDDLDDDNLFDLIDSMYQDQE